MKVKSAETFWDTGRASLRPAVPRFSGIPRVGGQDLGHHRCRRRMNGARRPARARSVPVASRSTTVGSGAGLPPAASGAGLVVEKAWSGFSGLAANGERGQHRRRRRRSSRLALPPDDCGSMRRAQRGNGRCGETGTALPTPVDCAGGASALSSTADGSATTAILRGEGPIQSATAITGAAGTNTSPRSASRMPTSPVISPNSVTNNESRLLR